MQIRDDAEIFRGKGEQIAEAAHMQGDHIRSRLQASGGIEPAATDKDSVTPAQSQHVAVVGRGGSRTSSPVRPCMVGQIDCSKAGTETEKEFGMADEGALKPPSDATCSVDLDGDVGHDLLDSRGHVSQVDPNMRGAARVRVRGVQLYRKGISMDYAGINGDFHRSAEICNSHFVYVKINTPTIAIWWANIEGHLAWCVGPRSKVGTEEIWAYVASQRSGSGPEEAASRPWQVYQYDDRAWSEQRTVEVFEIDPGRSSPSSARAPTEGVSPVLNLGGAPPSPEASCSNILADVEELQQSSLEEGPVVPSAHLPSASPPAGTYQQHLPADGGVADFYYTPQDEGPTGSSLNDIGTYNLDKNWSSALRLQCAMRCRLARGLLLRQRLRNRQGSVASELLLARAQAWLQDGTRAMLRMWHISASREAVSDSNNIMSMQTGREINVLRFGKRR